MRSNCWDEETISRTSYRGQWGGRARKMSGQEPFVNSVGPDGGRGRERRLSEGGYASTAQRRADACLRRLARDAPRDCDVLDAAVGLERDGGVRDRVVGAEASPRARHRRTERALDGAL